MITKETSRGGGKLTSLVKDIIAKEKVDIINSLNVYTKIDIPIYHHDGDLPLQFEIINSIWGTNLLCDGILLRAEDNRNITYKLHIHNNKKLCLDEPLTVEECRNGYPPMGHSRSI